MGLADPSLRETLMPACSLSAVTRWRMYRVDTPLPLVTPSRAGRRSRASLGSSSLHRVNLDASSSPMKTERAFRPFPSRMSIKCPVDVRLRSPGASAATSATRRPPFHINSSIKRSLRAAGWSGGRRAEIEANCSGVIVRGSWRPVPFVPRLGRDMPQRYRFDSQNGSAEPTYKPSFALRNTALFQPPFKQRFCWLFAARLEGWKQP